jgi:hypothetical protein
MEMAAKDTKGAPLTYEFDRSGIGKIRLEYKGKSYDLEISKSGATSIWVYQRQNPVKWAAVVRTAVPGKMIDIRTLREIRDSSTLEIGQRAFFEMVDGTILQLVVVGVLYYGAGDDKDEVRFKYQMYDEGTFLIEPFINHRRLFSTLQINSLL